jgi:hypothetical protein
MRTNREARNQEILRRYNARDKIADIAASYNLTRQAIWHVLKGFCAINPNRKNQRFVCLVCHKNYTRPNCRTNTKGAYCSAKCYHANMRTFHFKKSRHGTRLARAAVASCFELQPTHVVHHVDHDERNNELANLVVFATASEHSKYHHWERHHVGLPPLPLWRGDSLVLPTVTLSEKCYQR